MLNENLKALRKAKGLSQEELAVELHVVRQTVSKWEKGLSVPDSDMLLALSEALETPVSVLLGETVGETAAEPESVGLKELSERLEEINLQFARKKLLRRKLLHWTFIAVCAVTAAIFVGLYRLNSPYLGWDFGDPETAVAGAVLHGCEWLFVRVAPVLFTGSVVGICLTRKKA